MSSRSRSALAAAAALAVACITLLIAAGAQPATMRVFAVMSGRLAMAAVFLGALCGWGSLVARALGAPELGRIATTALGTAATATLVGFVAPWWFPDARVVAPFLLVGWVLLLLAVRREWRAPLPPLREPLGGSRWLWAVVPALLLPALLMALLPPLSLDGLVYHLAIPRQAALVGHLPAMPWLQYSHFPLHGEMLYGLALATSDATLPQLLHLAAAIGTILVAARLAQRLYGATAAPWAALLLASVPMLNLVAGAAWNDWLVLLYLALALDLLVAEVPERAEGGRVFTIAALFVGAAAATKYVALPAGVILLPALRGMARRRVAGALLLLVLVALPWYGRNLLLTHNPVYPLLSSSPAAAELAHFRGEQPLAIRFTHYLFRPDLADESLGVLLPAAVVLATLVLPGRRRTPATLLLLVAAYLVALLLVQPTARAFAPLVLAMAITGGGAAALLDLPTIGRRTLAAAALALLPVQLLMALAVWDAGGHVHVISGAVGESAYMHATQPYLGAFAWIASHSPPAARVLVVGESRVFYLDRVAVYGSFLDPHPLTWFAGTPPDAGAAARALRRAGIGLVYVFPPQLHDAPRPPGVVHELQFYATPEINRCFDELLTRHARLVFRQGDALIYALLPPPVADG